MFPIKTWALAVLWALAAVPVFAHTVPLTDTQKVRAAEHIVVAKVARKDVRWNAQRTLIVTDYTVRVEDRLKGEAPRSLRVTVAGGTLGGETHESCLSTRLEEGRRYVLFLNDLSRPAFTPFTGATQGVFRELPAKNGNRLVAQGQRPDTPLKMDGRAVPFATFVASLRDLVADAQAKAVDGDLDHVVAGAENPDLPAQEYVPLDGKSAAGGAPTTWPVEAPALEIPLPTAADLAFAETAEAEGELLPILRDDQDPHKYVVENRPPAPIVFNPLPSSFSFSPADQNQMAYWNRYARDLFRVRASTGTWSFGNGVFDQAGFPDNATMIQQFGHGWGRDVLGVTWSRVTGGRIIEADVALNPAFSWTLDGAAARQPAGRFHSFQQTMLHELGHTWGLKHPWATQDVWWDSVMNYAPKQFRVPVLWADDTNAARQAFPGLTIRDGAVSSWTTKDRALDNNPTYVPFQLSPPSGPFATTNFRIVNPVKIENTGTVPLRNPVIEVWASRRRYNLNGAYLVKTVRLNTTIPTFFTLRVDLGTFRMPPNAPAGSYAIAIVLRDAADAYQDNNVAW